MWLFMLTNGVSLKHFHFYLSLLMAMVAVSFLFFSLYLSYSGYDVVINYTLFCSNLYEYMFSLSFTSCSLLFSGLVRIITRVVFMYSYSYIGFYSNYKFFLITTLGFVISMLMVINFSDVFTVMLGWDGLGVISFFLIVYYNSAGTVYSGVFTILINRIGDSLLIVAIALLGLYSSLSTSIFSFDGGFWLRTILVLGLITKSAIFPFSPWLPAAMSAPTPISSLVHSSTLVTAGLYLMIRFSSFLYSFPNLISFLAAARVFTTFYAGLNSLVETDLKKLVALSTLSHLGFIGLSVRAGFDHLALFHLFTHALFKSLIFMSLGEVIRTQSHYQDIRFLRTGVSLTPESSVYIFVSSLSLLGLPFVRGFYSKDMVLESLHFSYFTGIIFITLVYFNLFFTYIYTSRIINFCVTSIKNTSYLVFVLSRSHTVALVALAVFSLMFGKLYLSILSLSVPMPVVPLLRSLPSIMLILVLVAYFNIIKISYSYPSFFSAALGSMLFLTPIDSKFFSSKSYVLVKNVTKTLEHGMLRSITVLFPSFSIVLLSRMSWYFIKSPVYLTLYALLIIISFIILL